MKSPSNWRRSQPDDVRALIGELDRILAAEYTPQQLHGLALDAILKPGIRFFLGRLKGAAVGCGGVTFFTDFAELKRMYVRDVARGSGAAWALLARIERGPRGWICPAQAGDRSPSESSTAFL
jgi:putative acetyltransferase